MTVSDRPGTPTAAPNPRRVPLLELMPADVRQLVEGAFTPVSVGLGEVIVAEGDRADAMFVIPSGPAQVIKAGEHGHDLPLNVLRSGDMFGERSLLDPEPHRTATVRASSPVQALRLDRGKFQALVHTEPEVSRYVQLDLRRRELRDFLCRDAAFEDLPPDGMRALLGGLVTLRVVGMRGVRHVGRYGA